MADTMIEMKTLTVGDTTFEIVDDKARNEKISLPKDADGNVVYGNNGQILKSNGDGSTEWVDDTGGGNTSSTTTVTSGSIKTILTNIMAIIRAQVNLDGTPQAYNPDISAIAIMTDQLIANLGTSDEESGGETDGPTDPEVTLSNISAIYTGGNVTVGTALSSLTGIVVTVTYSDGTMKNVTGYTLSGEIVEGSNIITVSYGGLTTTFEVTGVAESKKVNITQDGTTLTIVDALEVTQDGTTLVIE